MIINKLPPGAGAGAGAGAEAGAGAGTSAGPQTGIGAPELMKKHTFYNSFGPWRGAFKTSSFIMYSKRC